MRPLFTTTLLAVAFISGCTFTYSRQSEGTIERKGHTFTYTSTNTEKAGFEGNDDPEDYAWTVTMPDGSQKAVFGQTFTGVLISFQRVADAWIEENAQKDSRPATEIAGAPENPNDLVPVSEDEPELVARGD